MKNLIAINNEVNGVKNIEILVEGNDLYSEFFDDHKHVILIGKINQIFAENNAYFLDVVREIQANNLKSTTINSYENLKKSISAFLGNLQTFLSGLQRCCDNDFFVRLTNAVHSNHKGYQICYEMRNVLQHKGLNFSVNQSENKKLTLDISVEELLADYKISEKKRKEIFTFEKFDLIPQLNEFYFAECEIYERIFLHIFDDVKYKRFFNYVIKYKKPTNQLCICKMPELTERNNFNNGLTLEILEVDKYYKSIQLYEHSKLKNVDINYCIKYSDIFSFLNKE